MKNQIVPFICLFEEKSEIIFQVNDTYDENLQMAENYNGPITHYETGTGGHNDTDTASDWIAVR